VAFWTGFLATDVSDLAQFALTLLKIVVNQAGCERVFSDLKIKQTHRRARLGLQKLDKMTKVSDICSR
jgi:hypothetical protein